MRQLDQILNIRRDINSYDLRIIELRQSMAYPKAQTISDMPRGGERKNSIEEFIIKLERLNRKRANLECRLNSKWKDIKQLFVDRGVTEVQSRVMELRFYHGLAWKRIVTEMEKLYPDTVWNEQKLFRIYRAVIGKIYK